MFAFQEEVVYEDLCSFKNPAPDRDDHSLPLPPISSIRQLQPKEKRDHCIKELVGDQCYDFLRCFRQNSICEKIGDFGLKLGA
jgi:hypothetical protein